MEKEGVEKMQTAEAFKGLTTIIVEETESKPEVGESWVALPTKEFEDMINKAAKIAITELRKQEERERKRNKFHNTFTLMKCYRDAVFHIENAISDGEQLELDGMTDEQHGAVDSKRLL